MNEKSIELRRLLLDFNNAGSSARKRAIFVKMREMGIRSMVADSVHTSGTFYTIYGVDTDGDARYFGQDTSGQGTKSTTSSWDSFEARGAFLLSGEYVPLAGEEVSVSGAVRASTVTKDEVTTMEEATTDDLIEEIKGRLVGVDALNSQLAHEHDLISYARMVIKQRTEVVL